MIRMIIATLPWLLASFLAYSAPVPELRQLPGGNYLEEQNCRDCYVNGKNLLVCICRINRSDEEDASSETDDAIEELPRTVDLNSCPGNTVEYQRGYLICDNRDEDEKESVRGTEGDPVTTESGAVIDESPSEVPATGFQLDENMELISNEPEEQPDLPDTADPAELPEDSQLTNVSLENLPLGDYIKYCDKCSIRKGILQCECHPKTSLGTYINTTLPISSCSEDDTITYRSGTLMCQKDLVTTLFGSTCRNCSAEGNKLTCECAKTPCQWSRTDLKKGRRWYKSTLNEFRYCTSKIVNCNGQLRCGGCAFYDYYEEYLRPYEGEVEGEYCHHLPPSLRFIENWWRGQ